MTGGVEQSASSSPRRSRIVAVVGSAAAALVSLTTVVLVAVAIPPPWQLPFVVVTGCGFAYCARASTRRGRHGLSAILVIASVVPVIVSQWTVRQSDLLPLSDMPIWGYLAVLNAGFAALLFLAGRFTRARAYAPIGVLPAALALFGAGVLLAPGGATSSQAWLGTLLVALASAGWPLLRRSRAARIVLRSVSAVSAVMTLALAAMAWPSSGWGTSLAFLVTAAAFAIHLFWSPVAIGTRDGPAPRTRAIAISHLSHRIARVQDLGAWKGAAAVGIGLAVTGTAAAPAVRFTTFAQQIDVTASLTAGGAVLCAALCWSLRLHPSAPGFRVAGLITLMTCALTVIPTIGIAVIETWSRITVPNFSVSAVDERSLVYPDVSPSIWLGAAALTLATAATLAAWGRLRRFSWLLLALGGVTLLIAQATALTVAASTVASAVLSSSAVALFLVLRPRRGRRIVLISLVLISAPISFLVAANSTALWPLAAIVAIGCVVTLRASLPRHVERADRRAVAPLLTAVAGILVLFTARWAPLWGSDAFGAPSAVSSLATVLAASAILIGASLRANRTVGTDSSVLSVLAALAAVLGIADLATYTDDATQLLFIVGLACVLVAELSWQVSRGARHSAARYVTAALTPPTAVLLAVETWRRFGPSVWGAPELLAVSIAVLLAALGILLFRAPPSAGGEPRSHPARLGWDSSIALTSIVTVPAALTTSGFGALNLVLLGVLPVVFALGEGSLSRGSRPRRHLVWACIPPLGGAVWLTLAASGIDGVESYALAMAALVAATLAIVSSRRPPAHIPVPPGRNLLTIGSLAVFLVPSVIASGSGPVERTALVLVMAAVLACLGAFLPPVVRGIHLALWLWGAGVLTAIVTTSVRAFTLVAHAPFAFTEILIWSVCGAAFVTIFGALWLARRHPQHRPAVIGVASAPLLLSLPLANVSAVAPTPWWMLPGIAATTAGFLAVGAYHRTRAHQLVAWMATLGTAFLLVGTITGGFSAVEFVSVPVGLVAFGIGLRRLARDPHATSWHTLGMPLGIIMVPSLVQCLTEPDPLRIAWLILEIAATAAYGVAARLKAPLVIAASAAGVLLLTFVWPVASAFVPVWALILVLLVFAAAATQTIRVSSLPAARALRSITDLR